MTPKQYCQQKASSSGSSFYYSFIFLPRKQREAIVALYAFCREVDDIADECSDVNLARTKLSWWRNEIKNLFHGNPQHPVSHALHEHLATFNLSEELFLEIIDGMEMDCDQNRYASFKELQLYCYRVASAVGLLSASIFGFSNRNTLKYAHDLGMAFQLTNIIRDVGEDARRNRIYLPQEEITRFGLTENDILAGNESEKVRSLIDYQIERAETFYDKALNHLPKEDRHSQRTGLMMAAIYRTLLREIKADGSQKVLNSKTSLGGLRKLWLAWLTWIRN